MVPTITRKKKIEVKRYQQKQKKKTININILTKKIYLTFLKYNRVSKANNDNTPIKYAKNKITKPKISVEISKKYKLYIGR